MATQTEAQIQDEIADTIATFEELAKAASKNTPSPLLNIVSRIENLFDRPAGDHSSESRSQIEGLRASLSALLSTSFFRTAMDPLIRNYAKVLGEDPIDAPLPVPELLRRINDNFVVNNKSVNSRNITYGSPLAAGGNFGDGVINRLTVDQDGNNIEALFLDGKEARVIAAQGTGGLKHEEILRFRADDKEKDNLELTGSGIRLDIRARSARDSLAFGLRNPSFSQRAGSDTTPTSIPGWTPSTPADFSNFAFSVIAAEIYRGFPGDTLPKSVIFKSNDSLEQKFSVGNIQLDDETPRPVYSTLAFNDTISGADGTIKLTVGGITASATLTGAGGWKLLKLPFDQTAWPKHMVSGVQDPGVKIELVNNTTGVLFVDDVILTNWVPNDNTWYMPVGGRTPWLLNDVFTWADVLVALEGIINRWFWIGYNFWFRSNNAAAETWADPTV